MMSHAVAEGVLAVMLVNAFLGVVAAAEKPTRFMPFLCRDAVVRESAEKVPLVGKGTPAPAIVLGRATVAGPRESFEAGQVQKAGEVLAKYLEKIVGVQCAIVSAELASRRAGPQIFLGDPQGRPAQAFPELSQADAHGFVIAARGGHLHIVGGSGMGTLYGVWFFLQNYAGLRLVMHEELGEVYEKRDRLEIPRDLYVLNPGPPFLLRIHSGTGQLDMTAWLADAGDSQRFHYHHSAWRIYDPGQFGTSHPEFYPVIKGKRFIPPASLRSGWQPTISEPAAVRRAVEFADEQFKANPDLKSISLALNDGGGFSELDDAKAQAEGKPWTDLYYAYVNAVAREVKKQWPDRYVAFLNYGRAVEPPSFPLEDNCMLFVWTDDGNPQRVIEKWQGKVRHFGCYQWIYGSMYQMPNHWPHAIKDFLQYLRRQGAIGLKTEFYDVQAHGCVRLWVLSNLLWNPDADVDALLADYYEHSYGPEAAPAMARYFAQWEQVYERRRTPEAFNLVNRKIGERQFDAVTDEDLRVCAQAVREAAEKAVGAANQQRVEMTARLFENARRHYALCQHLKTLRAAPEQFGSPRDAEDHLAVAASFLETEESIYEWRCRKIEPVVAYCGMTPRDFRAKTLPWPLDYLRVDPRILYVTGDGKWLAVDGLIKRITQQITLAQGSGAAAYWSEQARLRPALRPYAESERLRLLHPNAPLRNLVANGSFETAGDPGNADALRLLEDMRSYRIMWNDCDHASVPHVACEGWNAMENRSVQGVTTTLDRAVKRHGEASLRVHALGQFGGVITRVTLPTPRARYRLSFWCRAQGGAVARYGIMFYLLRHLPWFELGASASKEWTKVELEFPLSRDLLPDEKADISVWLGIGSGASAESQVWFDDVRLEQLSPSGQGNGP